MWQTLDALVNLAIDNVKDQALTKFNINSKNANLVSTIFGLGIPVKDFALLSATNVWKRLFSDEYINFNKAFPAIAKDLLGDNYRDILDVHEGTPLSFERLDTYLSTKEEDLELTKDLLVALRKLYTIGDYMRSVSSILTSLRSFPSVVEDVEELDTKVTETLGVSRLNRIATPNTNSLYRFKEQLKEVIPAIEEKYNKIFDVTNLLRNHYHVFSALRGIHFLADLIEQNFNIHHPKVRSVVSYDANLRLDRNLFAHRTKMRRELGKYVLTNLIAKRMDLTSVGKVKKYGREKEFGGIRYWMEQFIQRVEHAKKKNQKLIEELGNGYIPNSFLKAVVIDTDHKTGYRRVRIHSGSTFDGTDAIQLEDDFKALHKYKVDQNGASISTDINPNEPTVEYTQFQKDFVWYNILTSGLNFGITNYSAYLPYDIYQEIDSELQEYIIGLQTKENLNTYIVPFYIRTATANSDKMKDIKIKEGGAISLVKTKSETELGVNKGIYTTTTGGQVHYDLLFETKQGFGVEGKKFEPLISQEEFEEEYFEENEEQEFEVDKDIKKIKFPFLIRKSNLVYVRVFTDNNHAAYQAAGSSTQVDTSILPNPETYRYSDYFNSGIKTLRRENINNVKQVSLKEEDLTLYIGKDVYIATIGNIFRTERKLYTVIDYNEETKMFNLKASQKTVISFAAVPPIDEGLNDGQASDAAPEQVAPRASVPDSPELMDRILNDGKAYSQEVTEIEKNGIETVVGYTDGVTSVGRLTDEVKGFINKYLRRDPYKDRRVGKEEEEADRI